MLDRVEYLADHPDLVPLLSTWFFNEWGRNNPALTVEVIEERVRERLNQGYSDDPQNGLKVWQTILHVVTHGIQHRSEAAAILTGYGHSPGELDFDLFLYEQPDPPQE